MELQWPLIIFTLLTCLAAGTFGVQGILSYLDKGEKLQMPALVVSFVAIVVAGIASFVHLQHWERIFNGFGHLTSGITQELIAIALFTAVIAVYFVMMRRSADGKVPEWCSILAVMVSAALVIVMSRSYNMPSRPAWDTWLLPLYYLSNAALFGGSSLLLISGVKKEWNSYAAKIALGGGILQVLVTFAYAAFMSQLGSAVVNLGYYIDPTNPLKPMEQSGAVFSSIFTGDNAILFWLGVAAIGLAVPVALAFLAHQKKEVKSLALYAGVGLTAALIGGACFRVIIYTVGVNVFQF